MRRLLRIAALCCAVLASDIRAQDTERVLARVNDDVVTSAEFTGRYVDYLLRTGLQDQARLRRAMLEQMINDRLLVDAGRAGGINDEDAYAAHRETARRKLLIDSVLEADVLSKVEVTDSELQEAFVRINTDVEARHLFAHTRSKANALRERLLNGETFEALAKEVFVDTALANNGGALGTFTFDELDADFEDAAFALAIGEVSEPVRTAQGFSIIQVTNRFTKPILTESDYARQKDKLRTLLLRRQRGQARSHFIRARVEKLDAVFHRGFDRLLAQVTGRVVASEEDAASLVTDTLVTFVSERGPRTWTVGDFSERAAFTHPDQRAQVRTSADLSDFITGLVIRDQLIDRATELDIDEAAPFQAALAREMDDWILVRQKQKLSADIDVPEDSIRAQYDRYPTEFTDQKGAPLAYEAVWPQIAEQLDLIYVRDRTLDFTAALRREAAIAIEEPALLGLTIAGRAFEAPDEYGENKGGTH
jgi:parvulin-like peptidyl-prolyl isomerase